MANRDLKLVVQNALTSMGEKGLSRLPKISVGGGGHFLLRSAEISGRRDNPFSPIDVNALTSKQNFHSLTVCS